MAFVRGGTLVGADGHRVRVRSFYMDRDPVTNRQYCEFLNDGNARHFTGAQEIARQGDRFVPNRGKERAPVCTARAEDRTAFARWAGKRLPTDAERQWAAGAGCGRRSGAACCASSADGPAACPGFRCVRPARRVLVLLGENFEEIELAGYTGVLSWAAHTTKAGNYMIPKGAPVAEVPSIEVVVAGFAAEVHGMGGTAVRPHVLVKDLTDADIDRFDAVAIPACVGSGRGQHTWAGQADLESDRAVAIVRRVHANGGIISTMCAGAITPRKAKLPLPKQEDVPVAYDPNLRTATSLGPGVALEAACLLVQELVTAEEYRSFRKYNPWLFGGRDQYPPRMVRLK